MFHMQTLLHIGYSKTATSWFQVNFYPKVKNYHYIPRSIIQEHFLDKNPLDYNSKEVKSFFRNYRHDNVIICEEQLLGRLQAGGALGFQTKEVALRLKETLSNPKIIIFIRNQFDIILSTYFQYIKNGGNYGIHKYFGLNKKNGKGKYRRLVLLNIDYFNYYRIIKYYSDLFGRENLYIYLYEELKEHQIDFLKFFSSDFNFDIDYEKLNLKLVNESYRRFLFYLKRLLNTFTEDGPLFKYYLFHIPRINRISRKVFNKLNDYRIFGKKLDKSNLLKKDDINYILTYFSDTNRRLIKEFGLNKITDYNYPL